MRAHWRHLANMIELVLPSAHQSPQPKWQINQFSHFCTVHGKVLSGMPEHVLHLIITPLHGESGPGGLHLIHASLGSLESKTQTASRSVKLFLHRSWQGVAILYNGPPLPPFKIAPSLGGCGLLSNTGSSIQSASQWVQSFLHGSLVWQTDHATPSVTTGRIYILWCGLIIQHKIMNRSDHL